MILSQCHYKSSDFGSGPGRRVFFSTVLNTLFQDLCPTGKNTGNLGEKNIRFFYTIYKLFFCQVSGIALTSTH